MVLKGLLHGYELQRYSVQYRAFCYMKENALMGSITVVSQFESCIHFNV